jgi:hypothetical protein
MQFTSKLTKEDYNEFRKLTGADSNLAMFVFYPIGMAFALLRLWRVTLAFVTRTPSELPYFVLGWIVAVGFIPWTWFYRAQQRAKALEQMNAMRPDTFTFTDNGLDCKGPAGAMTLIPWPHFTSWREGKRVLLLKYSRAKRYTILPISRLSDMDRAPIRQFLQSHIAPLSR